MTEPPAGSSRPAAGDRPPLAVRDLRPEDRAGWEPVWAVYLEHYAQDLPASTTRLLWDRLTGPEPDPRMGGLAAFDGEGALLGFAHYVTSPSTWDPREDAYLEDLCVRPGARGRGVGRALIDALAERGRERGWRRVHWHTEQTNAVARLLYDTAGTLTSYVQYERRL